MSVSPFTSRAIRTLRRIPLSTALAVTVVLTGTIFGTTWSNKRVAVLETWGVSLSNTFDSGHWWSLFTALVIPRGMLNTVTSVLGMLLLMGYAERRLGTRRTLIAWLGISVIAMTIGLALQIFGAEAGEVWADFSANEITMNPLIGVVGPLMMASALAPALWRRRIRLWTFSVLITVLLYDGNPGVLYATVAALFGLVVGHFLPNAYHRQHGTRASAREVRTLISTMLALTAIGPLVGLIRHDTDSPLSPFVYLIERQNVILVLLAAILLCAFGLSRGTRWGFIGAIVLNLMVAALGLARVDFTLLLSDTAAPSQAIEVFIWNFILVIAPLAFIVALFALRRFILVAPLERGSSGSDQQRARDLLLRHGGTMSYLTMWSGNRYWFRSDGNGYVAYREHNGVAVTCGDPVCAPEDLESTVDEFVRACDQDHLIPAFYSASSRLLPMLEQQGWSRMSVGEETVVHTLGLDFSGSSWANVRNALRRGEREGLRSVWTRWTDLSIPERQQILAISEEWVAEKSLPEMGFTLGSIREIDDPNVYLMLVVDEHHEIQVVTSWLPSYENGEIVAWTNDFMRRATTASGRLMEFVIAQTALHCAATGIDVLSLSGAPLAAKPEGLPLEGSQSGVLRRLGEMLSNGLEPAYGFKSLFAFKSKFNPEYRTLWLMVPDALSLPVVALAIARAYLPYMKARDAVALVRDLN